MVDKHIYCEDCDKDITKLIYKKGDDVVVQKIDNNKGFLMCYCKKCIKKRTKKYKRFDENGI